MGAPPLEALRVAERAAVGSGGAARRRASALDGMMSENQRLGSSMRLRERKREDFPDPDRRARAGSTADSSVPTRAVPLPRLATAAAPNERDDAPAVRIVRHPMERRA
jgi:hypothetical protein